MSEHFSVFISCSANDFGMCIALESMYVLPKEMWLLVKKFTLSCSQVSLKERQASERYYMKRYAQDWINSSKCDEDKASFTTEHPRFAELVQGKLICMYRR